MTVQYEKDTRGIIPSEAETAFRLLRERKQPMYYRDLLVQVLKEMGNENPEDPTTMASVYTRLNLDMRFVYLGAGMWGLRTWAPAKANKKIPTISLLNKSVDYDDLGDSDDDYDDDRGGKDKDDWERAD